VSIPAGSFGRAEPAVGEATCADCDEKGRVNTCCGNLLERRSSESAPEEVHSKKASYLELVSKPGGQFRMPRPFSSISAMSHHEAGYSANDI
jgi:hypothetical protein